jgi:hypothetical protein
LLGYLNPFSYIIKETPSDEAEQKGPLAGKSIVSVFGVPLFTTDTIDDSPDDVLSPPVQPTDKNSQESGGGFFNRLNPFKR